MRPDVGTQAQFKKKKPPQPYRYDSSLSPALDWDGQNPARDQGEALIRQILDAKELEEAKEAASKLKALGQPFLNWAGKAERLSFDVPTLPLFVHERLSTMAIMETLKGHKRDPQLSLFDFYNDPQHSVTDQILGAYEHKDKWVNRMILGDSMVVMNSLLRYELLGGEVRMIYLDPPYGVQFGSNFQPFVRKRDVRHNEDSDMTREPEMVQAYRDTWEMGLHSYLTYVKDRLLVAQELLHPEGSIFVQINNENVHHMREVMDEVFGSENFVSLITFQTTSGFETKTISALGDYLLWYSKDKTRIKVNKTYEEQPIVLGEGNASWVLLTDGTYRGVSAADRRGESPLPEGARLYKPGDLLSQGAAREPQVFEFEGKPYQPGPDAENAGSFAERMLEVLRRTPVLRLEGNKTVTFKNVRPPTKTLSLSAEALVDASAPGQSPTLEDVVVEAKEKDGGLLPLSQRPVAFVFGPENGAVSEKLVYEAAREAYAKNYTHLYIIGFAIQPNARTLVDRSAEAIGIPSTYVQATPDLLMGDLLKNMRSSQIFSVCGLPEVEVSRLNGTTEYQVELLGLDVFDPITMEPDHRSGNDVPAWFLDTDYNELCFHVSQAFFPRTSAWDNLKRALKGEYEDSVWDHLSGTISTAFEAGDHKQIAVKVIDDRGNELMVVKALE